MERLPEIIKDNNPLSDKLHGELMKMAKKDAGYRATQWIHLSDAVERGTVSPMEAYDAIKLGYCPEVLKIRKSRYYHLM